MTRVDEFDFDLPAASIALHPARPRDSAKLLVVDPVAGIRAGLTDRRVRDLPDLLRAGDILCVNDTRVIPARLTGTRLRAGVAARIEATLHKRENADCWRAFVRPAKKLAVGERVTFRARGLDADSLEAEVLEKGEGGEVRLRFAVAGPALDERIAAVGAIPLPPYIETRRAPDEADRTDYQTVFARDPGAVAAPTAGLHFTPDLIQRLAGRGVGLVRVTLHVGAGTFLPVKADDIADHRMHAEWGTVSAEAAAALNAARSRGGRIVAVGTTSLRIVETATDEGGTIHPFAGDTAIFITPGYRFKATDLLMTNFHLPRSTLFMLVSAFCGKVVMREAYAHAIATGYRFYSYGDATLLHPGAVADR